MKLEESILLGLKNGLWSKTKQNIKLNLFLWAIRRCRTVVDKQKAQTLWENEKRLLFREMQKHKEEMKQNEMWNEM